MDDSSDDPVPAHPASGFDDLPLNEVLQLYYEKHHAIRQGNLIRLLEMRKSVPELFLKEQDDRIRQLIAYAKRFQRTVRYKELLQEALRKKFSIVVEEWEAPKEEDERQPT